MADFSKLAARDYEDILQCSIPAFEGLLPSPHDETILDLLYIMSYWHSLAKLRMHTDSSLHLFEETTVILGNLLRYFAEETCCHFDTQETDKEYQARNRAHARNAIRAQSSSRIRTNPGRQPRTFNLTTPKIHFFPDYAQQIRRFGTTECFSTLVVGFFLRT